MSLLTEYYVFEAKSFLTVGVYVQMIACSNIWNLPFSSLKSLKPKDKNLQDLDILIDYEVLIILLVLCFSL